jgi:hypothetical protein
VVAGFSTVSPAPAATAAPEADANGVVPRVPETTVNAPWKPLEPDGYPNYAHREQTPRIVPEHIVTTDAEFLIGDATPFPRFPFTCWLPPHHRAVFIHHQPPPTAQPR